MALKFFNIFGFRSRNYAHRNKNKDEGATPLFLTNTLSGKKEEFFSLKKKKASMYSCGLTVYDYAHVGNLRSFLLPDILRRTLVINGYEVKQAINFTDFGHLTSDADEGDDKMTYALKKAGKEVSIKNMQELGRFYEEAAIEDLKALNIETKDTLFPRASEHIDEQIMVLKTLEEKGYTYETSDGVYFDTSKYRDYGKLGNIDIEHIREGARIKKNEEKKNPTDFVLWKKSADFGWDSPWGMGFPGWHIECTAMIFSNLGKQIDVHTGGADLIPIHHNNEIAQGEAASGKKYASYWLHNAFVTVEGQKISKSLGNTIMLKNVTDRGISPFAYRYFVLSAHYRTPINFTWEALEGAHTALTRLHRFFVEDLPTKNGVVEESYQKRFLEIINNDLDTPKALALLQELTKDGNLSPGNKRATLLYFDQVLGLGFAEGKKRLEEMLSLKVVKPEDLPKKVQKLVDEREEARKEKDWEKADAFRKKIEKEGYSIKDTEKGPEIEEN
ncbi:MAG: cysteine--tRNA ligase [Candidatus Paceibacterota bacterium]